MIGTRLFPWVGAVVAVLLLGGVAFAVLKPGSEKTATVYFTQVVNVYPGDPVKLMGVQIGAIDSITPEKNKVRVDLHYDADAPIPADAGAAILAPTLVSGRFVQLAPARSAGPRLADGAVIDVDRTVVPVEWGQIVNQLNQLSSALGPQGANKDGSVTRLLNTTAANLQGNGSDLHATIESLSQAVGTLSNGRDDLFGTVRNLQTLVTALAESDQQVGQFNTRLAQVSGTLADSSGDLATMLDTLDSSVQKIGAFIRDNRNQLSGDLDGLKQVSQTLADNRQALADILQKAPTAISNFQNIYDPFSGSITGAFALTNLRDPAQFLCGAIFSVGGTPDQCKQAVGPLADLAKMDVVPVRANPIQRDGGSNQINAGDGVAPPQNPTLAPPAGGAKSDPPQLTSLLAPGGN
ncbi:MAG: phospholipid/cholesterol/gamma-HCH transport system substrate-binding protein [Pseudonocardiales bacterium]|nr:phospholipid/cholesterol/gamma-HCH transport system substrate-binding protein [Pseudonocardiales bacterium]